MSSISANISVGWPIPTGLKVDIRKDGDIQIATLSWDNMKYLLEEANKLGLYKIIDYSNNNIDKTLDSFIDNNYPLGQNPTVPRLYRYDLSANYL